MFSGRPVTTDEMVFRDAQGQVMALYNDTAGWQWFGAYAKAVAQPALQETTTKDAIIAWPEPKYVVGPDLVNHPPHYTSHPSGVECIEITKHMGFPLGSAVKYIWRADLKGDAVEDLKKAVFFINCEIERRQNDS